MEDAVAQYCALNNIAVFVNDDGIIITKGINDAAKGDAVSKKGKKKVVVDIDHLDQQKGKKGAVKHQKGVSFADLPKKGSKKAVSKKRVRSEDEDEDVDESANLKKQRSVVSLPSPEINFSDLSSLSEAHELRSIFVEARSKCVDMIPAYDLVIGDIDAYFKSLASVGSTSARNKPLNQQQLDEVIEVDDNLTKDKSQGDEDAVGADIVTDVEDVAGGNKVDATEDVVGVDKATSAAVSDGDSAPGSVLVEDPVTDGGIVHAIVEKPVPDDGGKEKDAGAEKIIQDVPIDQEEDDDDDDQDKDDTNSNAKGSGEDSGDDDDDNSGAGGGLRVNDSVKGSTTNDDSSEADRGVNEPPPTKDSTHTQDGKEPESNDAVGANAFSNFVALSSLSKEELIALQDVVASITYDDDKNVSKEKDVPHTSPPQSPPHVCITPPHVSSPLEKLIHVVQLKDGEGSSVHFKDLVVPKTVSPIKKDSSSSSGPKQAAIPIPVFVSDSDPKIDAPKPKITVPIKAVPIKIFKSANSDAPITEVPVLRSTTAIMNSEQGIMNSVVAYCLNKSLDPDEILYIVKDGEFSTADKSLNRADIMTLLPDCDISVSIFNEYIDMLNKRFVGSSKVVKRWIFKESFAGPKLLNFMETQPSQESMHGEIQDMIEFTWAKGLDFRNVDYVSSFLFYRFSYV
ncbi:hypothetical protein LINPERHAP2_LOCUS38667 [Linum perenne]